MKPNRVLQRNTQTGSILVEIEEPVDPADGTGSSSSTSAPRQAFLSSADRAGVPELSIPRSPCPAEEAAAVVSVSAPASADVETARQGVGVRLNGESDGRGAVGGGPARRQVSDDGL